MVLSMDRWIGKVAVVTGASSGIGAAITKKLVEEGMIVVGLARRKQKVEELASTLGDKSNRLHSVKCDISKEQEILEAFKWTVTNLGPVHVLVNNAGCFYNDSLSDGSTEIIRTIVDTNLIGLTLCCKEGIRSMKANNIAGHIININSILGHSIPTQFLNVSMYPATKFAVRAATETIRMELAHQGSPIKITVVGLARRKERIDELANNLGEKKKQFYSLKCDISHEQDILDAFEWITKKIGPLYVLVNSAGCFRNDSLTDGKTENMKQVVDTNLIGLTICCREAIRIMKENNIAGHIININSILGQHIPRDVINVSMYCPTKFAVRAVTETLRLELIHQDSPIKTTNICPGATETEISLKALKVGGYAHLFPENKMLLPEDVADAVTYALSTPPQVQIKELTLKPLTEKF